MTGPRPAISAEMPLGGRREMLDLLRRLAVHLETAEALERRADQSPNATLVAVLRGRAVERREMAERLRADLAASGVVPFRRRCRPD
ncbi:MAG: hypothetical protein JWR62_806 [Modestobacter sp.]|jgi:hypothetical protein|nr:hypothetical protein [Modestobacter sp.]